MGHSFLARDITKHLAPAVLPQLRLAPIAIAPCVMIYISGYWFFFCVLQACACILCIGYTNFRFVKLQVLHSAVDDDSSIVVFTICQVCSLSLSKRSLLKVMEQHQLARHNLHCGQHKKRKLFSIPSCAINLDGTKRNLLIYNFICPFDLVRVILIYACIKSSRPV